MMDQQSLKTLCIQPLPGIGDMVWYLPHLRAIADHTPGKRISILTKRSSLADQLLANESWCGDILWIERDRRKGADPKSQSHQGVLGSWRLSQELRSHGFQEVWILHHSSYYRRVCTLAGIPKRRGYSFSSFNPLLTDSTLLPEPLKGEHPRKILSAFLEHQGFSIDDYSYPMVPKAEAIDSITQKLGQKPKGNRIVLGIGASGPKKCWPLEKFQALAAVLLKQNHQVILCGGPSEQPMADHMRAQIPHQPNLIDGTRNPLQETIALLQACDFYIGNDTSLMNLAVNQGKKAFTFFGPTYTVYNPLTIPLTSSTQKVSDISLEEVLQRIDNPSF